jgi:hypothetical protein
VGIITISTAEASLPYTKLNTFMDLRLYCYASCLNQIWWTLSVPGDLHTDDELAYFRAKKKQLNTGCRHRWKYAVPSHVEVHTGYKIWVCYIHVCVCFSDSTWRYKIHNIISIYLRGLRSMHTFWYTSLRKLAGDSSTTCCTRSRVFRYSTNLFRNPTKCSAVRMLPGTASGKRNKKQNTFWRTHLMLLTHKLY